MITLEPHQKTWKTNFIQDKEKLSAILSDIVISIEHIGSTAIPGIKAKPVIDIMIGVKDIHLVTKNHIDKIRSLGYNYIKDYEKGMPNRRYFERADANNKNTHHIHMVNYHSAWWQRHIAFRDYLNKYNNIAKEYEYLKTTLASALNDLAINPNSSDNFFKKYLNSHPELITEYKNLQNTLGDKFTNTNKYALAKSIFIQDIYKKAFFDFEINKPIVQTKHLNGYIPQIACLDIYKKMFQDPGFIHCYGAKLDDNKIKSILERDTNYWDQYGFGPYVWFCKKTNKFVGEGGLNHVNVAGDDEIEITYSLCKDFWGQGLALEIGEFAINQAFSKLKLNNIVCFADENNLRSLRVIEKLKFKYEKDFVYKGVKHKLFRM